MKKNLFILTVLAVFVAQIALAQSNDKKDKAEFKNLYERSVLELSYRNRDVMAFRMFDSIIGEVKIAYTKKHSCLCNNKQCHGPRLNISINSNEADVVIFPNGDCFAEINHFSPGVDMVEINIEEETANKKLFKEAAKRVLEQFIYHHF